MKLFTGTLFSMCVNKPEISLLVMINSTYYWIRTVGTVFLNTVTKCNPHLSCFSDSEESGRKEHSTYPSKTFASWRKVDMGLVKLYSPSSFVWSSGCLVLRFIYIKIELKYKTERWALWSIAHVKAANCTGRSNSQQYFFSLTFAGERKENWSDWSIVWVTLRHRIKS
jgi:hypothetical protein